MVDRFEIETFEVGTYNLKWLFGFVFEFVCKLHINEKIFICDEECFDIRGKNPKKTLKKKFYKGEVILARDSSSNKKVKIQYKDGWVYVFEI